MRTKPTVAAGITRGAKVGNVTLVEYQPGNGTRYVLQFTDFSLEGLALYTDKDKDMGVVEDLGLEGYYVVALLSHGTCMRVAHAGGYLAPEYVQEKLKVGYPDALVLAEVIAHFTGRTARDASEREPEDTEEEASPRIPRTA